MHYSLAFARVRTIRMRASLAFVAFAAACNATDATGATGASDATDAPPADAVSSRPNNIAGAKLFVNPVSPARGQADAWRSSRPADAAMMDRIATRSIAQWVGDWNDNVSADVAEGVAAATSQGAVPVFVAYNIPHRDCGEYSAGGAASASAYQKWIRQFAAGLAGKKSVVVLEPDAVASADCLSASQQDERFALLRDAVQVLKTAKAVVYIDAGNARWLTPREIADRLGRAGVDAADGFSLNVSNFLSTAISLTYGTSVSQLVGGRHFIIDTSRNGVGGAADGEWCNPPGQSLGAAPTTNTGHTLADAFLWIKYPGESDGTCHGGPVAGEWWADYALGLAQRTTGTP
jgi:endoglucanase